MAQILNMPTRSKALAMRCTACGVEASASCACGVAYEPASVAIARALKAHPTKSNRAIAEIVGVTHTTVNQVRAAGGNHFPPEKVEGRDGKTYTRSFKPKALKRPPPTEGSIMDVILQESVLPIGEQETASAKDYTSELKWTNSISSLAGEAIAMVPFWTKHFGPGWKKFVPTSATLTLAREAADVWTKLAKELSERTPPK